MCCEIEILSVAYLHFIWYLSMKFYLKHGKYYIFLHSIYLQNLSIFSIKTIPLYKNLMYNSHTVKPLLPNVPNANTLAILQILVIDNQYQTIPNIHINNEKW